MVRMYGTRNLLATSERDFIRRYTNVPIAVMLSHTRTELALRGRPKTGEERALYNLDRSRIRRHGERFAYIGLERPDIVRYLDETAIRELYP